MRKRKPAKRGTAKVKAPELLCPAGDEEKLRAVILYGADAVYLSGERFGMRSACDNFTRDGLLRAVEFAHSRGVRVYVTVNTMPHGRDYAELSDYLDFLDLADVDAVIVSDLGVFSLAMSKGCRFGIHISTQASVVSAEAARAWHSLGAERVVLARELTLEEIKEIRENTPPTLSLEAFVHGSMCISYSGRCLLSNYFTGRDANGGACSQPCRWNYTVRAVEITEEKRPGTMIPVEEHPEGTFVMSSRDMCMIEHIPELIDAGIDSFKIEGRVKSAYYGAVTANAYKIAIENYCRDPEGYVFDPALLRELESVSHREYCTGFFFGPPNEGANTVSSGGYLRDKAYLAAATGYDNVTGKARFVQKNKVFRGDEVELVSPGKTGRRFTLSGLEGEDGTPLESTPHPGMIYTADVPFEVRAGDILRSV